MKNCNKLSFAGLSLIFCWFVLLFSCGNQTNYTEISGVINGKPNAWVLLREAGDNTLTTIDSTSTNSEGAFYFSILTNETRFLLLQFQNETEPIVILVEPKEKVEIFANAGDVAKSYSVSGSKGTQLVRSLNLRLNATVETIDSLSAYFRNSREKPNFDSIKHVVDSSYFKLLADHKQYTVNFVKENRYSLAAILALYQQYDSKRKVLNKVDDFSLFKLVDSTLYPMYPNNSLVQNLHSNVEKMGKQIELYVKRNDMFEVDSILPNVSFPLLNGEFRNIMQIGWRYTLIDFWATWCNTCGSVSKGYKPIYQKYKSKGFEILQFSLDDSREELLKAVERDSLVWLHAFDSLGWHSPIVDSLRVNAIPANYLIDRKGVVKAKNLSVQELNDMLEKLFP